MARARKREPKVERSNGATLGFEQTLWAAADKLGGHMDPAEYGDGPTVGAPAPGGCLKLPMLSRITPWSSEHPVPEVGEARLRITLAACINRTLAPGPHLPRLAEEEHP
jgi:hypothetical protein